MVKNHYRWDFIGLSTDTKPTPDTSEKVADGSTFYESDTSKYYVWCQDAWYEKTSTGGGGGGGAVDTVNNVSPDANGNVELTPSDIGAQAALTAGSNITIDDGTISATDTTYTAGTNVSISSGNVISATDTTYSNFVGTDGTAAGTAGLVPAPATTDAGKVLSASGSWTTPDAGIKTLTTADYNYPTNNPTTIALWLLEPGAYSVPDGVSINLYSGYAGSYDSRGHKTILIGTASDSTVSSRQKVVLVAGAFGPLAYRVNPSTGERSLSDDSGDTVILTKGMIVDGLTSKSATTPLSAKQGKYLNDNKADKTAFTGTDGTTAGTAGLVPAPAAGDESKVLKGDGTWAVPEGGIKTLTTADYNYPDSSPDGVALWRLDNGLYNLPHGVKAYTSSNTPVVDESDTKNTALVLIAKRNQCNITIFADTQYGLYIKNYTTAPNTGLNTSSQSVTPDSNTVLIARMTQNNLTSTSTTAPLSAAQGKILNDKIEGRILNGGTTAPTTSTVGAVGTQYNCVNSGTPEIYICTDVTGGTYTWTKIN